MARTKDDSGPNQRKCLYALRELVAIARTPRGPPSPFTTGYRPCPPMCGSWTSKRLAIFGMGFVKSTSHSFEHYKLLEKQGQGKLSTKLCDSNMHCEMQGLLSSTTNPLPSSSHVRVQVLLGMSLWSFIVALPASKKTGRSAITRNVGQCLDTT
ncbi:hypothetical protein BKA70DRAFT_639910 [Coprinopsis sp. MPI-PUGE-AT-0042]|nr:hypothetical protein BKA70DRAFT_639910 [Coprinopsis sp. MPI-PUGE-AT-0042]